MECKRIFLNTRQNSLTDKKIQKFQCIALISLLFNYNKLNLIIEDKEGELLSKLERVIGEVTRETSESTA